MACNFSLFYRIQSSCHSIGRISVLNHKFIYQFLVYYSHERNLDNTKIIINYQIWKFIVKNHFVLKICLLRYFRKITNYS